jgi:hypothetical protein
MSYNYTNESVPQVSSVSARDSETHTLDESDRAGERSDSVGQAIGEHMKATNDGARILFAPLDRDESLWMVHNYEHVAGYFVRGLLDCQWDSEAVMLQKMAGWLSVLPLKQVTHHIVWGNGDRFAIYLEAKLAT